VDDVAQAVLASIDKEVSGTFNLGSGVATSATELATTILTVAGNSAGQIRLLGTPPENSFVGFPALNSSRARHELGFTPRDLESGLRTMMTDGKSR
jgi:UDP-glucose 4-epimerase